MKQKTLLTQQKKRLQPLCGNEQVKLGDISAKLVRKKIKNLHLRICPPDGSVHITAPLRMNLEVIHKFVFSKLEWIKEKQRKIQGQIRQKPLEYIDGETHYLWGKSYLLQIIKSDRLSMVQIKQDQMHMLIPYEASQEKKQALMQMWYRQQLEPVISTLIAKWEPLMKVKVKQFFIQQMKTRWGSCNTSVGNIRLNTELAKRPFEYLEYVVVHEMIHLLEPSHNHRFKALMDEFMPMWRFYRKELNRYSLN